MRLILLLPVHPLVYIITYLCWGDACPLFWVFTVIVCYIYHLHLSKSVGVTCVGLHIRISCLDTKPTSCLYSMRTNGELTEIRFLFMDFLSLVGLSEGGTPPLVFTRPVRFGWGHTSGLDIPRWSIYISTWRIFSISYSWGSSFLPQRGQTQYTDMTRCATLYVPSPPLP